ncbi:MAG TPA: lysylphosphatidylglycerol synthase transmembrane domain-containing protein [Chloroflexia bacterium]|nr:lysylphosphatidylglycerol synthase transmembrane domain-containing protein [Chloroflexia bacterium]
MSINLVESTNTAVTPGYKLYKINWKRWAIRLAGTLLLFFCLWKLHLNLAQIEKELLQAAPLPLLAAVLLIFPIIALKTYRWQIILNSLHINLPFKPACRLYALGLSLGSFTPGQLGDAVKAWKLQALGYSLGAGLLTVVLDRLFDIALLLVLAIAGLFMLGAGFENQLPGLLLMLFGTVAGLVVLLVPSFRERLTFLAIRVARRKKGEVAEKGQLANVQLAFVQPLLITVGTSALAVMRCWLLASAIGLSLNLPEAVAVSSLATAAGLLPFSVSGIGTRDLALIAILGSLSYSPESAVSLSVLLLLLNLVNLVVGYALFKGIKEQ